MSSLSDKSEKGDHELGVHSEPVADGIYRPEVDTSGVDEKKLMRRIDLHVVPWLGVLYLLNFLDRGSIGNAKARLIYALNLGRVLIYDCGVIVIQSGERYWHHR